MKIVNKREQRFVKRFENILIGECFFDGDGDITLKIHDINTHKTSAVCLKDGAQWFPTDSSEFVTVSASVVIE